MNPWIRCRQLLMVSVAACSVVFVAHGMLGQTLQRERLDFALAAQFADPRGTGAPEIANGGHPVDLLAAEYGLGSARSTLLSVMPKSVAVGDIDGDGVSDLYIAGAGVPNLLLKGSRDGRFRDITDASRTAGGGGSNSAAFADYDHSGRQSLFVAGADGITLFHNDGKNAFSDATWRAGIQNRLGVLCAAVALGDLDGDGFPDLLVAAYTDLNYPPRKKSFTFPNDFAGADSRLFRNNGNGTFTDVTKASGLAKNPGRARKAIFADFDGDKRLDVLILRDDKPPVLYLNRGGWKFEEGTWQAGDDLTTHAFFDGAVADFNQDGKADLALWSTHSFRVLINQGNAVFERSDLAHMPDPAISLYGFRGAIGDFDDNGSEDVMTVDKNGRLRAFANHSGEFREVPVSLPPGFGHTSVTAFRRRGSRRTSLIAIQPDGSVELLERKTGGVSR